MAEQPQPKFFLRNVIEYWPLITGVVIVLLSIGHYQSSLSEVTNALAETRNRVSAVEQSTQTANINYATLSGKIDTTNGKLDLLLSASHLKNTP